MTDEFKISKIGRERVITLHFERAPVLRITHCLPLITDKVKITVNEDGDVTAFKAEGVMANKDGDRTKRQTSSFGYRNSWAEEVPDWLKRALREALED